ncbi:MAG: FAD-dependent oxidoreductase [Proteobacteria bacterium]|nr:FAD-dependent oxidoreductase [Pseudomonadota bacterium]
MTKRQDSQEKKLTRRQVIVGAGAATAALGALTLTSGCAVAEHKWDHESDIIVIGSGIGAATAAVTAREHGDSVTLIEKEAFFGGTSSKTAGVLWIPNNFTLKARGMEDSKEDCLQYLARFSYPETYIADSPTLGLSDSAYALLEAFYDNASDAIDKLRGAKALDTAEWRMFQLDRAATDYLDNVPENAVPAGRALGVLDKNGNIAFGAEMMAQLQAAVESRQVNILYEHKAMRLVLDDNGRAIGVEADNNGATVSLRARKGLIFGTGGYAHNPGAVARYQRNHIYGACAMPASTGDFIDIAGAAGARLGNLSGAWRSQVVLEGALEDSRLAGGVFYPPGDSAFQVNKYGLRAVNENRNYNDRTEAHGLYDPSKAEYPNQLLFMIYDQRTAEAFAGAYPLPSDPKGADEVMFADSLDGLTDEIGKRLEKLAARTGDFQLDASFAGNIKDTMARFNGFARAGKDEDFGRGDAAYDTEWFPAFSPMQADTAWPANPYPKVNMHPLGDEGPYYAIILAAGVLDTNGGPMIDAGARVLDAHDQPIPGLYGVGNCIASPSRDAYWGAGCPLGLSCTFGYIAANAAHADNA